MAINRTLSAGSGVTLAEVAPDEYKPSLDVAGLDSAGAADAADLYAVSQSGTPKSQSLSALLTALEGLTRYEATFDTDDLTDGVLAVNHGLGEAHVSVEVFNTDGEVILPTTVSVVDANNVSVSFADWGIIWIGSGSATIVVRR